MLALLFFTIIPEVAKQYFQPDPQHLLLRGAAGGLCPEYFWVGLLGDEEAATELVQNLGSMIGSAEGILAKVYEVVTDALPM